MEMSRLFKNWFQTGPRLYLFLLYKGTLEGGLVGGCKMLVDGNTQRLSACVLCTSKSLLWEKSYIHTYCTFAYVMLLLWLPMWWIGKKGEERNKTLRDCCFALKTFSFIALLPLQYKYYSLNSSGCDDIKGKEEKEEEEQQQQQPAVSVVRLYIHARTHQRRGGRDSILEATAVGYTRTTTRLMIGLECTQRWMILPLLVRHFFRLHSWECKRTKYKRQFRHLIIYKSWPMLTRFIYACVWM